MSSRRTQFTMILAGAALGALMASAQAADLIEAPVIHAPTMDEVKAFGGWYSRGDFGYSFNRDHTDFVQFGSRVDFNDEPIYSDTHIDDMFSLGVGVGAQMNQFLRTDITADYFFSGDHEGTNDNFCTPLECATTSFETEFDVISVLANIYVDMGTFGGVTPYVGAGVGFASVRYDDVTDTLCPAGDCTNPASTVTDIDGSSSLRLAWSLAAGASYDFSEQLALDAGYRFTRVDSGPISNAIEFEDGGLDMHQLRIGARYKIR